MKFLESRDKIDPIDIFIRHRCLTPSTPSVNNLSLSNRLRVKRVIAPACRLNHRTIIMILKILISIADLTLWK